MQIQLGGNFPTVPPNPPIQVSHSVNLLLIIVVFGVVGIAVATVVFLKVLRKRGSGNEAIHNASHEGTNFPGPDHGSWSFAVDLETIDFECSYP